MDAWTGEKTRQWLMKALYEKHVKDIRDSMKWSTTIEGTDTHPPGELIEQECKTLSDRGWVEILTYAYGFVFAHMASEGCEAWEEFLEKRETTRETTLPQV